MQLGVRQRRFRVRLSPHIICVVSSDGTCVSDHQHLLTLTDTHAQSPQQLRENGLPMRKQSMRRHLRSGKAEQGSVQVRKTNRWKVSRLRAGSLRKMPDNHRWTLLVRQCLSPIIIQPPNRLHANTRTVAYRSRSHTFPEGHNDHSRRYQSGIYAALY